MKYLITTLLISIFVVSCDDDGETKVTEYGKVLFQTDYQNYAWGFQHNAWFIDEYGRVYCYDMDSTWKENELLLELSAETVEDMLQEVNQLCLTITQNELDQKLDLVAATLNGYLSPPKGAANDAGISLYYAYVFNRTTNSYKRVVLKQSGDWQADHSTPEADSLYEWMKNIQLRISEE